MGGDAGVGEVQRVHGEAGGGGGGTFKKVLVAI